MIETFKIIKGLENTTSEHLFGPLGDQRGWDYNYKLYKKRGKQDMPSRLLQPTSYWIFEQTATESGMQTVLERSRAGSTSLWTQKMVDNKSYITYNKSIHKRWWWWWWWWPELELSPAHGPAQYSDWNISNIRKILTSKCNTSLEPGNYNENDGGNYTCQYSS